MEFTTLSDVPNTSHTDVYALGNHSVATEENLVWREHYIKWYTLDFARVYVPVFQTGICGVLCLMGVVNNVTTIIVFATMGFKETTNISMTAIACWDILKSLILGVDRASPIFDLFDFPDALKAMYFALSVAALGQLGSIATHSSSMVAVYVAVERCLCVSMPFTVRFLLTRRTAIVACLTTSAFVFGSYSFEFLCWYVSYIHYPESYNRTEMFMVVSYTLFGDKNFEQWVENYISILNSVYPIVALCIMSVCTVIIVNHLKKSSKFRSKNAKDDSRQLSTRERKISKMLLVIIFFYILYLAPWLVHFLVVSNRLMPFWFWDLEAFVLPFAELFSLLNSSVNLYIFYFMSSEFNRTLRRIFHLSTEKTRKSRN